MNYPELILHHLCKLDIDGLRTNLKNEYSYQNTTKDIFLREIEHILNSHIEIGDTELLSYRGICSAERKQWNKCKGTGYRFIGNFSRNYFDLIFIMDEEDIKDIFQCEEFQTEISTEPLENSSYIEIHLDERIDFRQTPEYWDKVKSALGAYDEIMTSPTKALSFEEINYWLDKHKSIYDKIGEWSVFEPLMKWTSFASLYHDLAEFRQYILHFSEEITKANSKIKDLVEETTQVSWLVKNEKIYEEAPLSLKYGFEDLGKGQYIWNRITPIIFKGRFFKETFQFFKIYEHLLNPLLSKYDTLTENEVSEIWNDNHYREVSFEIDKLSFHLDRREAAKQLGVVIPFYIKKIKSE